VKYTLPQVRKFLAAALGSAAVVASQLLALGGVIPDEVAATATVIVAAATALGVYRVPNDLTDEQKEKVKAEIGDGRAEEVANVTFNEDAAPILADPALVERILNRE